MIVRYESELLRFIINLYRFKYKNFSPYVHLWYICNIKGYAKIKITNGRGEIKSLQCYKVHGLRIIIITMEINSLWHGHISTCTNEHQTCWFRFLFYFFRWHHNCCMIYYLLFAIDCGDILAVIAFFFSFGYFCFLFLAHLNQGSVSFSDHLLSFVSLSVNFPHF